MITSSTSALNEIASLNIGLDQIAFVLKIPSTTHSICWCDLNSQRLSRLIAAKPSPYR